MKPLVIHPFLFAISPILALFAHNADQVLFAETLIPTAIVLGFAFLLFILLRLTFGDNGKAGIILFVILAIVFSYAPACQVLRGCQLGDLAIGMYLLPACGLFMAFFAYCVLKARITFIHNFTNALNIFAAFLVLINLINIGAYTFNARVTCPSINDTGNIEVSSIDSKKADILPDIYYIILDRYASTSTLKEIYTFDNAEFIDYLSNRGFYIASQSRSNYLKTAPSLASSLNMEYINYLTDKVGEESSDWTPLFAMLQDYKVWRFLRSKGYKFIHFGSWWGPTSKNRYADMNFNLYISGFSLALYRNTIFHELGIFDWGLQQWKRIMYEFEKLAEVPNIKGPTFVFAHLLVPHPPYVFGPNGEFRITESGNPRECYRNQLIFTNKKTKILIDKLLSTSEVPPIIVLQADEGPLPPRYERDERNFNWKQASEAEIREKMGILNAYYLPNVDKNILYTSITPVNSFRVIFNLYFDTNLELLADESYAHLDDSHPYEFFNVTDKVK